MRAQRRHSTIAGRLQSVGLGVGSVVVEGTVGLAQRGLAVGSAILALLIGIVAWPVWLFFLAGAGAWLLLAKRKDAFSTASVEVLRPVTLGLALLTLFILVVNVADAVVSFDDVVAAELAAIRVRLWLKDWVTPSWPVLVALLGALLTASLAFVQLRLVTRFLYLQKLTWNVFVVSVTLTTFTFAVRHPTDRWATREQERRVRLAKERLDRHQALIKERSDLASRYVAAVAVQRRVNSLDESERQTWRAAFEALNEEAARVRPTPWDDYSQIVDLRERVAEQLAEKRVTDALNEPRIRRLAAQFSTPTTTAEEMAEWLAKRIAERPLTGREWVRQSALVAEQEKEVRETTRDVEEMRARVTEATAAASKVFSATIGLAMPPLDGLVGVYVKKLVSTLGDRVFRGVADQLQPTVDGASQRTARIADLANTVAARSHAVSPVLNPPGRVRSAGSTDVGAVTEVRGVVAEVARTVANERLAAPQPRDPVWSDPLGLGGQRPMTPEEARARREALERARWGPRRRR